MVLLPFTADGRVLSCTTSKDVLLASVLSSGSVLCLWKMSSPGLQ